jgi:hypothetical protein
MHENELFLTSYQNGIIIFKKSSDNFGIILYASVLSIIIGSFWPIAFKSALISRWKHPKK